VPVFAGAALTALGGEWLLNAIDELLPSPLEIADWVDAEGNTRASSPDAPPAVVIFNTVSDPFSAYLYMGRVLSGTISTDMTLKDMETGESERMGNAMLMLGKNHTPLKEPVGPGAIIALSKLKSVKTGHTLADEKILLFWLCLKCHPSLFPMRLRQPKKAGKIKFTRQFKNCCKKMFAYVCIVMRPRQKF
jgi:translation elongation factor 2 (EF-2/EF-G)